MSHELMYTSVARGLRPGEHGFCTVAVTQGIPAALTAKLESLCGYRHLFPPSDRNAHLNPVLNSHLRVQVDGRVYHILSRIMDAGLDYSQRTNKFAHHLVLDRSELPPAGPAWLLSQPHVMELEWNGRDPQILPTGRRVPAGDAPPRPCRHWQEVMGDAGWGGVLASMTSQGKPAYLIFEPGVDPLPLIAESLALLPSAQRWALTFSTYYLGLPPDIPCQWRCLVADSAEAASVLESNTANVIVLDGNQGEPPDASLVEAARTGKVEREAAAPGRPTRASSSVPVAAAALPPAVAAGRRQSANTSAPNPRVENEEPAPMTYAKAKPPAIRSGNLTTLALGLALGLVLMLFCILPIELLSGRSLPRMFGMPDKDELALKSDLDKVRAELEVEKGHANDLQQKVRDLQAAASASSDPARPRNPRPKPDDTPNSKPDEPSPSERPMPKEHPDTTGGKQPKSDNDKPAGDPDAKETKPADKPGTPEIKNPNSPEKSDSDAKKPKGASQGFKPVGPPTDSPAIQVKIPLLIRDPDSANSAKAIPLEIASGSTILLLGLPMKVGDALLDVESGNSKIIEVNLKNRPVCVFRKEGDRWEFAWARNADDSDLNLAREALRCCVLVAKQANGDSAIYPLSRSKPLVRDIKRPGTKPIFNVDLMFQDGSNAGNQAHSFVLRNVTINVDGVGPVELKDEGGKLVGNIEKDQSTVGLTISGSSLQVSFSSDRSVSAGQSIRFDLYRKFAGLDAPLKVAEVKCNYRAAE